ncbi:MAG: LysM peptidoglycan-binding domain-containing protein [Anaerolineae bacterium]
MAGWQRTNVGPAAGVGGILPATMGVEFDFKNFDRRYVLVLSGGLILLVASIIGLVVLLNRDAGVGAADAATATPTAAAPADTATTEPTTAGPPTETPLPSPTPTLEPYSYQVQEGETLLFIIQLFGYRDTAIVPEVLALNDLPSEDALIAGQTLLIPRQTPTPGPTPAADSGTVPATEAGEQTPADQDGDRGSPQENPEAYRGCTFDNRCTSPDGQYWVHEVSTGETLAGIAFEYDSSLQVIREDNNLFNDFINEGQIVLVRILVSPTPTLTPTGGPDATATPTPTLSPPMLTVPVDGTSGARSEDVILQWLPVLPLSGSQHYRVTVVEAESDEEVYQAVTRANIVRLPEDLRPGTGASVTYQWRVDNINGPTPDSPVVSGQSEGAVFTWGN